MLTQSSIGKLPPPSPLAATHSAALQNIIRNAMVDGRMPFEQFMQLALYAPGLGYYTAGATKFGHDGDFVTAPEISPLFAQCLARQCQQILVACATKEIIEFGAGRGILAADLLLALAQVNALPERYAIIELSPDLRERQQHTILQRCPQFYERVVWLDQLPTTPISGVILANEVMDAMPVCKFHYAAGQFFEYYVREQDEQFMWDLQPASTELCAFLEPLAREYFANESQYDSEFNRLLQGWITAVLACLQQGAVLLIDYGFPRHEYYHPHRTMGTLMCHYRHHSHANPLILPGLQDITAHVDMTLVAEAAHASGADIAGFTNQAAFLLNCGITDLLAANNTYENNQAVKQLTLASEMGELFKVIALTKQIDWPLLGFAWHDQRHRL